jgi:hypothetical protein
VSAEATVRRALRDRLLSQLSGPRETIEEFWVPRSNERADLVVVGGSLDAFEIKTDRDTLRRLPRQVDAYGRLFDRCTAVVAAKHLDGASDLLPEWWGITLIGEGETPRFEEKRGAQANPRIDPQTLVRLLWRDDAVAALAELGHPPDPGASRGALWGEILDRSSISGLRRTVRLAILNRDPAGARIPTRHFRGALGTAGAG